MWGVACISWCVWDRGGVGDCQHPHVLVIDPITLSLRRQLVAHDDARPARGGLVLALTVRRTEARELWTAATLRSPSSTLPKR